MFASGAPSNKKKDVPLRVIQNLCKVGLLAPVDDASRNIPLSAITKKAAKKESSKSEAKEKQTQPKTIPQLYQDLYEGKLSVSEIQVEGALPGRKEAMLAHIRTLDTTTQIAMKKLIIEQRTSQLSQFFFIPRVSGYLPGFAKDLSIFKPDLNSGTLFEVRQLGTPVKASSTGSDRSGVDYYLIQRM